MIGKIGQTYIADELNVLSLNVFDDHDLHLREEVERHLVDGVAEDGLLDEHDVAAGLLDRLAQVEDVRPLLAQCPVHLRVVADDHLVLHLERTVIWSVNNNRHDMLDASELAVSESKPTSVLGGDKQNWMSPTLAFSTRVGPPGAALAR